MEVVRVDRIYPNPEQPRKVFDGEGLEQLAASIRANGVIQPVVLEEYGNGVYVIHDGERRWRAAKMAGLVEIPAVVTPPLNGTGVHDRLVRAIVANIQREDLNVIDEARAYQRMKDELGMTVREISRQVGVYEARVFNRLALLRVDQEIQELMADGRLYHDKDVVDALLSVEERETRLKFAERAAEIYDSILRGVEERIHKRGGAE